MTAQEPWILSGALLELADCGENEMVAEILDVFVTDAEAKIESLRLLIDSSDFTGIGRVAHSLKGSARQIGLEEFASVAEKLERAAVTADSDSVAQFVSLLAQRWAESKRAIKGVRDSFTF